MQTHRRGLVSSQDPWPLPVPFALGSGQGDTGHAFPLNPPTVAGVEKPRCSHPHSHRSVRGACDRKVCLASKEMTLCVALCRRSCAVLVRMMRCWEDGMLLSRLTKPHVLHPCRIGAVCWVILVLVSVYSQPYLYVALWLVLRLILQSDLYSRCFFM